MIKSPPWNEAKLLAMLACLRRAHPARVGAAEVRAEMLRIGVSYSSRSVQRQMTRFKEIGFVYGDNEWPTGWRLTSMGCELLGVQKNELNSVVG